MKTVFALLCLIAVTFALSERQYQTSFTNWMQKHSKSYHHEDFRTRYSIYKRNLDFINNHNGQGKSYTLAMNEFGDLTKEEFSRMYKGLTLNVEPKTLTVSAPRADLPTSLDWRTKGAVTPVKNQQQCGSCWAFSTTGSVEGCHFQTTGKLVSLSEQNLVDCSGSYGNQGCNGGLMDYAMQYIIDNNGIDTEDSYPYTARDGQCKFKAANVGATLKSYTDVKSGSESDLQEKVNTGPTSIAIDASQDSFQFYSSGVYDEPNCSSTQLDHGVLAVGWGVDSSNTPYWIVKNSWGPSWGQNGYIWMSRNKNNQCGVATAATLPVC